MFRRKPVFRTITWLVVFCLVFYVWESASWAAQHALHTAATVSASQGVSSSSEQKAEPIEFNWAPLLEKGPDFNIDRVKQARAVIDRFQKRVEGLTPASTSSKASLSIPEDAPRLPFLADNLQELHKSYEAFRAEVFKAREEAQAGGEPSLDGVEQARQRYFAALDAYAVLVQERVDYYAFYNTPTKVMQRLIDNADRGYDRIETLKTEALAMQDALSSAGKPGAALDEELFSKLQDKRAVSETQMIKRTHRIMPKKNAPVLYMDESGQEKPAAEKMTSAFSLAEVLSEPTVEDSTGNVEVRLTQDIIDLAASLGNDPIRIFNWVRQNIEYVPYYGSMKGSQLTLYDRAGNDMDTASLLIALLRAAGVPSRYVVGVADIDYEKYRKMVNVETKDAVLAVLGTLERPGSSLFLQQDGTPDAARLGHTWVAAYLPSNYRGAGGGPGSAWIQLDPSVRTINRTRKASISEFTDLDPDAVGNDIISSASFDEDTNQLVSYDKQFAEDHLATVAEDVDAFYAERGVAGNFFQENDELYGGFEILAPNYQVLPVSLPFEVNKVDGVYAELPNNLRYQVQFNLLKEASQDPFDPNYDPISQYIEQVRRSYPAPELAARRVTLSYIPRSADDSLAMYAYNQPTPVKTLPDGSTTELSRMALVPADAVEVLPILRIDGQHQMLGPVQRFGETNPLHISITGPAGTYSETARHDIQVGGYHGIGFDFGGVTAEWSNRIIEQLLVNLDIFDQSVAIQEQGNDLPPEMELTTDEMIGAAIHLAAVNYFIETNYKQQQWAKSIGVNRYRYPSVSVISQEMETRETADFIGRITRQILGDRQNLEVDVDLLYSAIISRNRQDRNVAQDPLEGGSPLQAGQVFNNQGTTREEFLTAMAGGVSASQVEHRVMERQLGNPSFSAMKFLGDAMDRGEPMTMLSKGQLANEAGREISNSEVSSMIRSKMSGLFSAYPDVAQGIVNAVQQGNMVFCPQSGVEFDASNDPNFVQYDGTGYIYLNPATAAGGYIINSNLGGSATLCGSQTADVKELVTCAKSQLNSIAPACYCDSYNSLDSTSNSVQTAGAIDSCASAVSNFITLDVEGIAGDAFTCMIARIVGPAMSAMTSQMDDLLATYPNGGEGVEPSEELKRTADTISATLIILFGLTNSATSAVLDKLGIGLPFGTGAIAGGLFAMMLAHVFTIDLILENPNF